MGWCELRVKCFLGWSGFAGWQLAFCGPFAQSLSSAHQAVCAKTLVLVKRRSRIRTLSSSNKGSKLIFSDIYIYLIEMHD